MTKLISLTPDKAIKKLKRAGFVFDRQAKRSHKIWYNPETRRRVVIPNHPGKDIPKRTLKAIISQSGLSVDKFLNL